MARHRMLLANFASYVVLVTKLFLDVDAPNVKLDSM
jgi:hypothetical protein